MTGHMAPDYPLSYLSASQESPPAMHVGDRARKETHSQTSNVSNTVRIGPQVPLEEAKRRSTPYMNCYESFQTQVWPCRDWLISNSVLRINLKVNEGQAIDE